MKLSIYKQLFYIGLTAILIISSISILIIYNVAILFENRTQRPKQEVVIQQTDPIVLENVTKEKPVDTFISKPKIKSVPQVIKTEIPKVTDSVQTKVDSTPIVLDSLKTP